MRRLQMSLGRFCLCALAISGLLVRAVPAYAGTSASVLPTGLSYNPQKAGTVSGAQTFSVYNIGTTNITVTAITTSVSQFVVSPGTLPLTIAPAKWANFTVTFNPTTAKAYSGQVTVTITGLPSQKVTLNGTGTSTTAIATLSSHSLTFGSQPLGTTTTQALTVSNTGTTSFKLTGVTLTYPFSQTGFSGFSTSIAPGKSLTMQISFFPVATGLTNGSILLVYDSLANAGVSLSGSATAATSLVVTSYPTLPSATQKYSYQATLAAAMGTPPYTWELAAGSTLPDGLGLSSSGVVGGTLATTVAIGNYHFTANVTDSKSATVSAALTLPVYAATGSECNNIIFNASDGSGPLVPINDLGTGYYLNSEQGGLYANGNNIRPLQHDADGETFAREVQPLDQNGNPSSSGKIVLMSLGESIAQQPFFEFQALAGADPSLNPNLVFLNGATGGATASDLALPNNNFWNVITVDYLPNANVTAKQVQVVWLNDVNGGPSGTFPSDMTKIQGNYESIAQNLLVKFPNIKLVYFSNMNYTGYSNGLKNLSWEPYSYETGFAVKNAIQDQINGNANLNYNPANGKVLAPWIDWGPYYWANGMLPRSDGLVWTCQDLQNDGTHPSVPVGRIKVSTQLLNFFKSDDTASIWFLAPTH